MYNGIGLTTARGSGTNGYVQKSLAVNRYHDDGFRNKSREPKSDPLRKADAGILEHEMKRKVEVKCMELRMELEDKGMNDEEIEEEVSRLRTSLSATKGGYTHDEAKAMRPSDVHARAAAKAKELDNFGKALGIRSDYQTGQAFDRDLQEKKKQERMEARKAKQEAWERQKEEREHMLKEREKQRVAHPRERAYFDRARSSGEGVDHHAARDRDWDHRDEGYGPSREYEPRRRSPPRGPVRADASRDELDYSDRRRPSPPPRNTARSRSPSPRRRSSRSPSPDRRRGDSRSRSITPSSPPPRRRYDSRTPERDSRERSRRGRSPCYSRSPTPEARGKARRYDDHDDPRLERDPAGPSRSIRRPDADDEADRRRE